MNIIHLVVKKLKKQVVVHLLFLLAILVLSSVVSNTNADSSSKLPTAAEILNKAEEAKSTVDYVGKRIVIFWHPSGSTTFEERIIHQVPFTHITELLTPVDRMGFEREGDKEQSRRRMDKRGERDRMRKMLSPPHKIRKLQDIRRANTQLLLRNYTVDVVLGEQIAGQKTYLLTINPKVASRLRKKIWFDAQHYVILRIEHYDIAGKLNSVSVYTTIDYDRASVAQQLKQYQEEGKSEKEQERDFNKHRPDQSEEISLAEAEEKLGVQLPQPFLQFLCKLRTREQAYLPIGFQLQGISMVTFRGNPSIHFRYTDGLTGFSLFVSKVSDERRERRSRKPRGDRFRDPRSRGDRSFRYKPTIVTVKNVPVSVMDPGHVRILEWKEREQGEQRNLRFVLISELSREELVKVVESLVS